MTWYFLLQPETARKGTTIYYAHPKAQRDLFKNYLPWCSYHLLYNYLLRPETAHNRTTNY